MNPIAARLSKDHDELDALLRWLAQDAQAPLQGPLRNTWDTFEKRLLVHMEAEERLLLPLIAASHAIEVGRVRVEHAQIRDVLRRLGVAIKLDTIRGPQLEQLLELLRAHAKHEEQALYRVAGDKAPAGVEHSIAEHLVHTH